MPDSTVSARFWVKVDVRDDDACWNWTAHINNMGYGTFCAGPHARHVYAHRYSYGVLVGPIPDGLVLDHLCVNPRCVNPAHLEVVTQHVNVMRSTAPSALNKRKTHCDHGHEFTPENTYIRRDNGNRRCRTCDRERARAALARRRGLAV